MTIQGSFGKILWESPRINAVPKFPGDSRQQPDPQGVLGKCMGNPRRSQNPRNLEIPGNLRTLASITTTTAKCENPRGIPGVLGISLEFPQIPRNLTTLAESPQQQPNVKIPGESRGFSEFPWNFPKFPKIWQHYSSITFTTAKCEMWKSQGNPGGIPGYSWNFTGISPNSRKFDNTSSITTTTAKCERVSSSDLVNIEIGELQIFEKHPKGVLFKIFLQVSYCAFKKCVKVR